MDDVVYPSEYGDNNDDYTNGDYTIDDEYVILIESETHFLFFPIILLVAVLVIIFYLLHCCYKKFTNRRRESFERGNAHGKV